MPGKHKQPAWLSEPFVLTTVSEGYQFAQRCGRPGIQDAPCPEYRWDTFRELFSGKKMREFASKGITVFLSFSFFRTCSTAAEAAERELTRQAFRYCRKLGLRTAVYISDTLNPETIKAEYPDVESWAMRTGLGLPVYYSDEWWRLRACRINPKWKAFIKEHLRVAVKEFGVDMIHFDNFAWFGEPDRDCHCDVCVVEFRRFLDRRYTARQRRDRFGFSDVSAVIPPHRLPGWKPPWRARDPLHQDWLEFRCEGLAATYHEFADYIRALNPETAVELNPTGITGYNTARGNGVDHDRLLRWGDVFWSEEHTYAHVDEEGRLLSSIRSHKLARATNNKLLNYTNRILPLAEAMAFGNGGLGCVGPNPSEDTRRYIQFFHKHFRRIYAAPVSTARVALWRGSRALMLDDFTPHRVAVLVEQALIQGHRVYDLLLDSDLDRLKDYRAVIVPGMHVFEDKNEARLKAYLAAGGGLVLIEACGVLDERLRRRRKPAFAAELGLRGDCPEAPAERQFLTLPGGGRIACLPQVRCRRHPVNGVSDQDKVYGGLWKHWYQPDNAEEILDAVRWAAGEEPEIEILAPETVVMEVVRPRGGRCVAIHLINYQPDQPPGSIVVRIRPRLIKPLREATLLSPDRPGVRRLEIHRESGVCHFQVEGLKTYDVVLLT